MTARPARSDLTIGIVGPHDLVERIMLSAVGSSSIVVAGTGPAGSQLPPRRMVAAAYRNEREAAGKIARLRPVVDSWLFASPVPLARARAAGVLDAPATVIPLGGSALYAALLRAYRQDGGEPPRASVDLISRAEVDDAFAELGMSAAGVHVRGGAGDGAPEELAGGIPDAAELAAFHEQLWRSGATSAAFTCLPPVAVRLAAAGMPAFPVRPTGDAIRAALRTAVLLGVSRRLERAQLTIIAVDVPVLCDNARRAPAWSGREELRLAVHRLLIQQARRFRGTVSPAGEHCFLVTATAGSLADGAGWPGIVPFAAQALAELGVELGVGAGTGADAEEAAARARAAAHQAGRGPAHDTPDRPGSDRGLVPAQRGGRTSIPASARGLEILARLAAALPGREAGLVVDAETSGQVLGVTPRTARRLLHSLVEEGMAWPLPPSRVPQPGRPRQAYRLLVEKLQ